MENAKSVGYMASRRSGRGGKASGVVLYGVGALVAVLDWEVWLCTWDTRRGQPLHCPFALKVPRVSAELVLMVQTWRPGTAAGRGTRICRLSIAACAALREVAMSKVERNGLYRYRKSPGVLRNCLEPARQCMQQPRRRGCAVIRMALGMHDALFANQTTGSAQMIHCDFSGYDGLE